MLVGLVPQTQLLFDVFELADDDMPNMMGQTVFNDQMDGLIHKIVEDLLPIIVELDFPTPPPVSLAFILAL